MEVFLMHLSTRVNPWHLVISYNQQEIACGIAAETSIGRDGSPSRPTSLDGRLGKTSAVAL
jgi:hypothetical protein